MKDPDEDLVASHPDVDEAVAPVDDETGDSTPDRDQGAVPGTDRKIENLNESNFVRHRPVVTNHHARLRREQIFQDLQEQKPLPRLISYKKYDLLTNHLLLFQIFLATQNFLTA